jgi:hypothetical protein
MVRKARIQYISNYVQQVRIQTGYYTGYIPYQYGSDADAREYFERLKNDPSVFHAMNLLSLMACGEYVEVKIAKNVDPRLKILVENMLGCVEDFTHARKSLLYGGVLFGLGVQRKYYKLEQFSEFPGAVFSIPYRLQEVDRRRLRIERSFDEGTDSDGYNRNETYWTLWHPKDDSYWILEDRNVEIDIEDGAGIQDYIWYLNEFEELEPLGRGLGNILYHLVYIKSRLIQYWSDVSETWYKPWLTGVLDAQLGSLDAALGEGFAKFNERVNEYLDILDQMRARQVLVHPKTDEIKFHEVSGTGENIIEKFIKYIDEKIQLAILAAELTTGAPSVGSYALGQIHRGATQSVVKYNRIRLQEILERDLIYDFLHRNRIQLLKLGIPMPRKSQIKLEIMVEAEEQREGLLEAKGESGAKRLESESDKIA